MKKKIIDHYVNYLLSSFGQTSSTGLSRVIDNEYSHDQITRFLRFNEFTSKDLWENVKIEVRKGNEEEGVISLDNSILEKEHSKENELITWHFDHSKNRSVKGINFLTAVYVCDDIELPIGYELVKKTKLICDKKTGKAKRQSERTLNDQFLTLLQQAKKNKVSFKFVISDRWFSSAKNMRYIHNNLEKKFIMPIKKNRLIATSQNKKERNQFVKLESLDWDKNTIHKLWIKGLCFPVQIARLTFKNESGSVGILYLTTNDLSLTVDQMTKIYQKRWKIEVFHKSIKQNASLGKSPTKIVKTQQNHFCLSMLAYVRLNLLSKNLKQNTFAFKGKLYQTATKAAFFILKKTIDRKKEKLLMEIMTA